METSFFTTLADSRLAMSLITAGGIALCMPGIAKTARLGLWVHPVSIAAYLLGALALLLAAQAIFRWHVLPVTNTQALVGIIGIMVVKFGLAFLYGA